MRPISIKTLASICGGYCDDEISVTGAAVDSRNVKEGDLFFALPGEKVDGHLFLEAAKQKGAYALCVSKAYQGALPKEVGIWVVDDPLLALQESAKYCLQTWRRPKKTVALTGSVGKTTTKDYLCSLLSEKYDYAATPGNYNTHIGMPLSVWSFKGDEELLVLEMGMRGAGQIERLVEIAGPDIALLLSVHWQHGSFFEGGIKEIAKAKSEIFSDPRTTVGLYLDDLPHLEEILTSGRCQKRALSILEDSKADQRIKVIGPGKIEYYEQGTRYPFNWESYVPKFEKNLLAAISIARTLGLTIEEIQRGISKIKPTKMRGEVLKKGKITFVNDTYNASPHSVVSALENLSFYKNITEGEVKRLVVVLTELGQLGPRDEEIHDEVAQLAVKSSDMLVGVGPKAIAYQRVFEESQKEAYHTKDATEAFEVLRNKLKPGDLVLVKGTRDKALEKIVEEWV